MASTSKKSHPAPSPGYKFYVGQVVWCSWMGRFYKARILQEIVQYTNFDPYYMVHFIKFSKSWDSGVAENRLLACNKENNMKVKKSNRQNWRKIKENQTVDKLKEQMLKKIDTPVESQWKLSVDLCRLSFPATKDELLHGDKYNRKLLTELKTKNKKNSGVNKKTAFKNGDSANKKTTKMFKFTFVQPILSEKESTINAHSSNYNPTEIKNATLTSLLTVESNNKKNIKNPKRELRKDLNSKSYKIHKNRRKLKDIDLSLDKDDVIIGSHRLLCGEYKYSTSNKINENRNEKCAGVISEILNTFALSKETNISNEYVEVSTSNKEGNLQLFDDQLGSYSLIDKKLKCDTENAVTTSKTEEKKNFINQPDIIKMDSFISDNSTENDPFYNEVTTSELEVQMNVNDQNIHDASPKDSFLIDDPGCEVDASSNLKENFVTEIPNTNLATDFENNIEERNVLDDNDHYNTEVSTSESEQLMLNNGEDIIHESSCEVYNPTNINENCSLEVNEDLVIEEFYHKKQLDEERDITNDEYNQNEVEVVTTSRDDNLLMNIQQEFTNSNGSSDCDESSNGSETLEEEQQFNSGDEQDFNKTVGSVSYESNYEALDNSNYKECNSSTGNVIISTEESYCDAIIEDDMHSTEVEVEIANEEVTTSLSEEQLILDKEDIFVDSRSSPVHDTLISEENDNIYLKECNVLETTANTIEESCPEIFLEDERISVQDNYFEEEVSTSNPEDELTIEDQQQEDFINSKDCPIRGPNNDISCCDINRIITDLYNNDPCRISRVSMLENIEKSLDMNGGDTINDCEVSNSSTTNPSTDIPKNVSMDVTSDALQKTINLDNADRNTIYEIPSYDRCSVDYSYNSGRASSSGSIDKITKKRIIDENEDGLHIKKSKASSSKTGAVSNSKKKNNDNIGKDHIEKVKASSSTSTIKTKSNDQEVDSTKVIKKQKKKSKDRDHRLEKLPVGGFQSPSKEDLHGKRVKLSSSTREPSKKKNEYKGDDNLKKVKFNNEIRVTNGDYKSKKSKARSSKSKTISNKKNVDGEKVCIEKENIHKRYEKKELKDGNHTKKDLLIDDWQSDRISNGSSNVIKKKHTNISNSSPKNSESKSKKYHDLENKSLKRKYQMKKDKIHKEHEIITLREVDIFAIEDNLVSNYSIEPASNDSLIHLNKKKDAAVANSSNVISKRKKVIDIQDEALGNNHTKKLEHKKTKLKDLNIYCNRNIGDHELGNDQVEKVREHERLENTKSVDEEMYLTEGNILQPDDHDKQIEDVHAVHKATSEYVNEHLDEDVDDYQPYTQVDNVHEEFKETSEYVNEHLDEDVDDYQPCLPLDHVSPIFPSSPHTSNENSSYESASSSTHSSHPIIEFEDAQTNDCLLLDHVPLITPSSHQTSNDNSSCESASSSTHLSNPRMESEDAQTTDDDDQQVKIRKVRKTKRKLEVNNIFEQFGYENYTRAAKVKATQAISSQMKKPLCVKEKKNNKIKPKTGRKKDDDDPSSTSSVLTDFGITMPLYIDQVLMENKHLIVDDRQMAIVPAKLTVRMILQDFASKFEVDMEVLDLVEQSFNFSLFQWVLHQLERPKYNEMLEKYPGKKVCEMYGLHHLLRFLLTIPKLIQMWGNINDNFKPKVIKVIKDLLVYLDQKKYPVLPKDFDCIMPEYYRMS